MNPSNPQHDNTDELYAQFIKTLDTATVCAYCGNPVDSDGEMCCDDVHSEEVYDNGEEYLRDDDGSLNRAFVDWLAAKEAADFTGAKYEK